MPALLRAAAGVGADGEPWEYVLLALGGQRAATDLVLGAVDRLPDWHAAIVRGELAGKTGAVVARELGIPQAQFYRKRRNAFARLGQLIDERLADAAGFQASAPLSLCEMEIGEADLADRLGLPQRAIAQLKNILQRGVARRDRIAILGRLAELYAKQGKSELAKHALADARRCASATAAIDWSQVDLAEAMLAFRLGDGSHLAEVLSRLVPDTPAVAAPARLEASASALAALAATQISRSDLLSAKATFARIAALLAAHPQPPLHIRVHLLNLRAQMHIAAPASIGIARAEARTAFHLGMRHGLAREAWRALHTLVDHHLGVLDLPSVFAYAQYLLRGAQNVGEPQPIALASMMVAATQAQMGDIDESLRRIEACRPLVAAEAAVQWHLLKAYLLGLNREYAPALEAVRRARTSAVVLGIPNLIGVGFLYESSLLEASGSARGVREAAAAAAEVLERGTSPYHLARAYGRIYRLTGDVHCRLRARELASTFQAEGGVLQTLACDRPALTERSFGGLLTKRQTEIAHLLCAGKTNREIAREVAISESTAAHHVEAILRRLGLRARWQLYGTYVV
ncbi:MAG TPA: helix-turn-helix transcriptional regulator [Candidatus Cybelea sp.]